MNEKPAAIRDFSLTHFQKMNEEIYLLQNNRNYETADMVSRMHRYITQVLKAVRKEKTENAGFWLSLSFSWSLALANRLHIELESEMWKRFPGVCPYCNQPRCACKERAAERQELYLNPVHIARPTSLNGYQWMFAEIYPYNTLQDAVMHLAEEAGEVDEAIEHYTGTHDAKLFEEILIELVDVITNMLAVATCLRLDLATEMEKVFAEGCNQCHKTPCKCGFTTSSSVTV